MRALESLRVTLRKRPEPEGPPTKLVSFRCPNELHAYLKAAVEASRPAPSRPPELDMTAIVVGAVELDRELSAQFSDQMERLERYAAEHGLDMANDFPKVIAGLVARGLDCEPRKTPDVGVSHSAPHKSKR